jgi:hypothetical protein
VTSLFGECRVGSRSRQLAEVVLSGTYNEACARRTHDTGDTHYLLSLILLSDGRRAKPLLRVTT